MFTDPGVFFVTDWFPIYLVAEGIALKSGLIAVVDSLSGRDLGNFLWGRGFGISDPSRMDSGSGEEALVVFGGLGVTLLIPTIFTKDLYVITLLFAIATFSYASFSTIANVLPTDLFKSDSVGNGERLQRYGSGDRDNYRV